MKLRTTFYFVFVLFLLSTICVPTSFAQESPRQINILVGHTGYVNSVAFSPNGKIIASGDGYPGNTVRLWDAATGRLLKTMEHYSVNSVAFSPNGKIIASASDSGRIDPPVRLWDARTGTLLNELTGAKLGIKSVTFSPDGKTIAGTGVETCFWDVQTGTRLDLQPKGGGNAIAYSPDGKIIAIGSYGAVYFWDAQTREQITKQEHFSQVRSIAYSPDGNSLASAEGTKVFLWDTQTRTLQNTLQHFNWVDSVAYSPNGNTVASVRGTQVWLWDARTGTLLHKLTGHPDGARCVTYSPDGNLLAVGCTDRTVRLWRLRPGGGTPTFNPSTITDQTFTSRSPITPLVLPEATGGTTPYAYSVSALPVGLSFDTATRQLHGPPTTVVSAHPVTYTVRDAAGRTASLTFSITVTDAPPSSSDITFHPSEMTNQRFAVGSPIMSLVLPEATGGTAPYTYTLSPLPDGLLFDATVRLLTGTPTTAGTTGVTYAATDTGGTTASITFTITVQDSPQLRNTFAGHTGPVNSVAFSPDGNTLATAGDAIYLWEVATGILKTKFTERTAGGLGIAFSPDGKTMVSVSASYLFLWDVTTGALIRNFTDNRGGGLSVAYSPDGKRIAVGSYGAVNLWDIATGLKAELTGHTDEVYGVAYSPDGNTLVSGCKDRTVRLWNAITGELKNTIEHTAQIWSVAYSPDGSTIASTSFDNTVRLWDAATGRLLNTMEHTDWFPSVAYSPDGHTLASGCWDNTVRLWDAATGRLLNTLTGHTGPVNSVAFSPDGTTLATGSVDGTVLLWELIPAADTPENIAVDVNGDGTVPHVDVDNNGVVNVVDLIWVAANFGRTIVGKTIGNPDVNGDGVVDEVDLLLVIEVLKAKTEAAGAPALGETSLQQWIVEAKRHNVDDEILKKGIAVLEQFLGAMRPRETALLSNYPNPFNPETWIPYQLADASDVNITIYDVKGIIVRRLELGHQLAGYYISRPRAAYWNGLNAIGEKVSSGIYFYQLQTENTSLLRKMLIRK